MTWTVSEITLEAHYMGGVPPDRAVLSCCSITKTPGRYVEERGADGSIQCSISEPPGLIVRGVDQAKLDTLPWKPTLLRYKDSTGKELEAEGRLRDTLEQNAAHFVFI